VLFLSSRHMVAPPFEGLPGFDGLARRTPLLLGARPSETKFVLLSMTILTSGQARSLSLTGIHGFPLGRVSVRHSEWGWERPGRRRLISGSLRAILLGVAFG
jgi:hypothetical protein